MCLKYNDIFSCVYDMIKEHYLWMMQGELNLLLTFLLNKFERFCFQLNCDLRFYFVQ